MRRLTTTLAALALLSSSDARPRRRWAVVTGASSGLGAATAGLAAANGFDVLIAARRRDRLEQVAREVSAARPGARIECVVCDLASAAGQRTLCEVADHRDVGLVVLNAGVCIPGVLAEQQAEQIDRMIDLNVRSSAALLQHFARSPPAAAAAAGGGGDDGDGPRRILVVGSSTAVVPGIPGVSVYAASKAFLRSLAAGARSELRAAKADVSVTYAMPAAVDTEFASTAGITTSAIFTLPGVRRVGGIVMSAEAAAASIVDAALRGKPECVPGILPRVYVALADRRLLPGARGLAAFSFAPAPALFRGWRRRGVRWGGAAKAADAAT